MKYKLEMKILTVFLLLLIIPTALSVTRTISSSQDNIDSFIVNSHGNLWEANGSYIQAAIDNLSVYATPNGGYGGPHATVWLPANTVFTIDSTLQVEQHVTLDMQGSTIVPNGDFDVIIIRKGAEIKDGTINVSPVSDFNSGAIVIYPTDRISMRDHPLRVYNMNLLSESNRGTGLLLQTSGPTDTAMAWLDHYNIGITGFEYAIHINHSGSYSYINGNMFSDIVAHDNKYVITVFQGYSESGYNHFHNVHCYCTDNTEYIIWNNGIGTSFNNIIVYNWDNNSGTKVAYNFIPYSGSGDQHYGADHVFLSFKGGGEDIDIQDWDRWGFDSNAYTLLDLENGNLSLGGIGIW